MRFPFLELCVSAVKLLGSHLRRNRLCRISSEISFHLFLFTGISAHAEWEIAQRRDFHDANGKVHASELLLTDGTMDAEMQIVYFSPREVRFKVVLNLEGKMEGVRDAVNATGGIAGINGGYFEADLSPLGLLISNGHVINAARNARLLSGVFLVRDGRPEIIRVRELASIKDAQEAIQCGPFLVESGRPVPGLNAEKVAARTFIFCCGPSCWGFGTCRSITLAAAGGLLAKAKLIRDFRISQALNLDGGSSTTLYAKLDNREIFFEGRSIVSNYLIIDAFPARE
jgi:uncharacterized protein YigE (DUF2233 family)